MMGLYERVPFEQVIVCCGRQAGLQIYIRTWTPALRGLHFEGHDCVRTFGF
jgi:hypothetical protein